MCVCSEKLCNDWSPKGNVTTPVPATPGSGILCYAGRYPNYQVSNTHKI